MPALPWPAADTCAFRFVGEGAANIVFEVLRAEAGDPVFEGE
jgi:hypothetical protein